LSAPIWNHAPQATFLQFPWRLLAILAPVFALALARALAIGSSAPSIAVFSRWVGRNRSALPLIAIPLLIALSVPTYRLFRQPCDPADTPPARLALFQSGFGTDPTDEYTPIGADSDALTPNAPPYWLANSPAAAPPADAEPGPAPAHFTLTTPHPEELILDLRNYPAWRLSRNGSPIAAREKRTDGLIAVPIPAGPSTIDIRYARALDQTLGGAIALFALALFLFFLRRDSLAGKYSVPPNSLSCG
jgi:hypothetical protein